MKVCDIILRIKTTPQPHAILIELTHTGVEVFQTVYLCLVTGRMYFYLSSPTSNLNNIILFSLFETQVALYNH